MTITTTTHADWSSHEESAPRVPLFPAEGTMYKRVVEPLDGTLAAHMRRLIDGVPPTGDPLARARLGSMLHGLTGWAVFADDADERAYVSRLWAQDWDSAEDSVYDEE